MVKRSVNNFKIRTFKSKVLILCEGKTEENYFNAMKEDFGLPKTIAVDIFQSNKTDCKGIVEEAIKKAKKQDFQEIFVVFDHDNQAKRDEAFKLALSKNIKIIFSSICFEIWYFFHYKNSSKAFSSEAELETELKKCAGMENYMKNDFKHYLILKDKLIIAKSNSKAIRERVLEDNHNTRIYDLNPYTNIDELVSFMEEQKK